MKSAGLLIWLWLFTFISGDSLAASPLDEGWENPPNQARLRAYWWWLNGNVTRASIANDLREMKSKGFGGAVLIDANGADQWGNAPVPHGPDFFSPEWRDLYKFALQEADRLGLEISLNIQSGWNLGGPVVKAEDAAKKYVWSETRASGGGTNAIIQLEMPPVREGFYRDRAVLAYPAAGHSPAHLALKNWKQKALQESLQPFSAPDSSPLFEEIPGQRGEQDANTRDVVDLTGRLFSRGIVHWQVPPGEWRILRFGYTIADHAYVSTGSDGWKGFALDVYDAGAFQNYWGRIVEPLIADAGPLVGKTLKYLHTDSWEIELANWTPNLPAEFSKRRGYDLLPWLPVLTGRIINSREESDRFLFDYRKTLGDLAIDHHYRLFRDNAHKHGLLIHPESGGPHAVPIDAQRCLGWDDAPMSEFWAWSWEHRIGDENRFFVKQPASAAHTCGHNLVFAEGFTTIGPNWQETLWDNLKPSFNKALCEGMNVLVWHAFVCSPDETGIPGQQYFAGTHLNPKVTWWSKSKPFFDYINRCQWMLQQGRFSADVLYYYGDHVPNFAQLKRSDPARVGPGYNYDVISEEALLARAQVKAGKIVLPDSMKYRVLVLPDRDQISLPVLRKIRELVLAGATVIGPRPARGETLEDSARTDAEIARLGRELWGGHSGSGRVISDKTAREVLLADGVMPDCEFSTGSGPSAASSFDYIHRDDRGADIYFLANRTNLPVKVTVAFRGTLQNPELWNPVTGKRFLARSAPSKDGRTIVSMDFAPFGSWFVVFRHSDSGKSTLAEVDAGGESSSEDVPGPWTVHFDPKWGGPEDARFDQLESWADRPEPGIKYYSGTAVYETTLNVPDGEAKNSKLRVSLDLGSLRELAEVRVNGKSCGILWCPPWRVDVTPALKTGMNKLEIEIVSFWPNRIIGDASLPPSRRFTQTNIRALTGTAPLANSGLFGPVKVLKIMVP